VRAGREDSTHDAVEFGRGTRDETSPKRGISDPGWSGSLTWMQQRKAAVRRIGRANAVVRRHQGTYGVVIASGARRLSPSRTLLNQGMHTVCRVMRRDAPSAAADGTEAYTTGGPARLPLSVRSRHAWSLTWSLPRHLLHSSAG
jgi:hypothetical protein